MRRNQIICRIIVDSGLAKTYPQALSMFVQTFVENFRQQSLEHWDTHIPAELAEKFMNSVQKKTDINIHSLINELDDFIKKSKLALVFLLTCQVAFQHFHR
jgi:hypothetical protein